jgi:hypothetical protein
MKVGKYSPRARDMLIGTWVEFQKKVDVYEVQLDEPDVAYDVQLKPSDTMTTNDSTIAADHPAYRRHKKSALRLRHSRSITPACSRSSREASTDATRPPKYNRVHGDIHTSDHRTHNIGDHAKIEVGSDMGKTGHVILTASDMVEVLMDDNYGPKYFSSESVRSCKSASSLKEAREDADLMQPGSKSATLVEMPANWNNEYFPSEGLRVIARSPSSAFAPVDPPGDKAYVHGETTEKLSKPWSRLDEHVGETRHDSDQHSKARPPKPKSAVRGFRVLKSRIPAHSHTGNTATQHLSSQLSECATLMTGSQPKASVTFHEPHHVVTSLNNSIVAGECVDIVDGMYKNKTGRVVKVTEELAQVVIGGFVQPFYLSPLMLRPRRNSLPA